MVEIVAELGEVARPFHSFLLDHEGEGQLGIAVFSGMKVQHPADKGPFQPCAGPHHGEEAAAGNLDPPLEVDQTQLFRQVPVGQRIEIKGFDFPPTPHHKVPFLIKSRRDVVEGKVGQAKQDAVGLLFEAAGLLLQFGDPLSNAAHFPDGLVADFFTGPAGLAYLAVDLVAVRPEIVPLGHRRPPLGVQLQQFGERVLFTARLQGFPHRVGVAAYKFNG